MEERADNGMVQQIDLISMFKDIVREWWSILLLAVAAALIADIWVCAGYEPEYTTSTTFIVSAKGMNNSVYQNLSTAQTLAEQMTEILDSTVLKKKVAKDLGISSLNIDSTVTQITETNMITLTVTAGSAVESYRVLNSIMENYDTVSDYVIKDVIIQTIQPPVVPTGASNYLDEAGTRKKAFLIAALVLVAFVGGVSYIRDTIKKPSDVSVKLDARLLGSICHERKARTVALVRKKEYLSMLITNPLRSFQFVESNKMTAARVRSYLDQENAKVVLITSVMENEGKSTVAANMALGLAREGNSVMLIDCDFRKPAQYKIFNARDNEEADLGDVLTKKNSAGKIIRNWNNSGLYLILNKTSSNSIETLLKSTTLKQIVSFCRARMDYVIIDTSPMALVSDTEELAQMADASILVVKQDTVLTKDINDVIDILNNTGGKTLGCILNGVSVSQLESSTGSLEGGHYGK